MMTRRHFSTGAIAVPGLLRAAGAGSRPNVLLILTDDQGAHAGALCTPGVRTPRFDELASGGVLFHNAFAATASCSPSRCSILTGMYPHSNGLWRNVRLGPVPPPPNVTEPVGVHEDLPTLPEILNKAGYETGIMEKFHLSPAHKFPFTRMIPLRPQRPETYRAAVSEFIAGAGSKPFFLMANTSYPHRPFRRAHFSNSLPPVNPEEVELPQSLPDVPELRADWADYLTSVQCGDAIAGGILDALRASGRERDTIVIFTGDQGPAYVRGKATMYNLGTHVPLSITGPGIRPGQNSHKLASLIDLAPTILDYAGLPVPRAIQGRSLRPLLSGDAGAPWRQLIFAEHNAHGPAPKELYPCRSVFDGRMHYIRNLTADRECPFIADTEVSGQPWDNRAFAATVAAKDEFPIQYGLIAKTLKRPAEELYDVASDRDEMRNVADDTRYAAPLGRLREAIDAWMKQTGDPGDPSKIARRG